VSIRATHRRRARNAAGRGARLRGVTGDHPKCLARIGALTLIERQVAAEALLDVIGRNTVPDDVCRIARHVIKYSRVDLHIVRERKKTDARTDTCADNADLFIALLFQPANSRTRINNGLPERLQCPADIRSDKIVGTIDLRRLSLFVIRQRHAQGG